MDKYEKIIGLAKRRGFLWNSFELYGGTAGFYDYGPLGAMLKRRIEDIWRKMYVIEEGFYEIETPTIGIAAIFDASGHTRGFSDPMVVCSGCDHAFRADHLIEGIVETPDALPASEIKRLIDEHGIKCPQCGGVGTFGDVSSFNLMFKTTIGPGAERVGYLRPETAQGMFVDFEHLFRFYREKLPFGVTQIGKAYRNEISPRQGVIRLREFTQAEAEIFINPSEKNHPRFSMIEDTVLRYYPASHQRVSHPAYEDDDGIIELTARDAVDRAIVAHEFLAYHLVLTHLFLVRVGIDPARLRFRQHQPDEMAHYAVDCWDAEVLTDRFGWVEIVGIADRSDYDLSSHAEHSKKDLSVLIEYDTPKQAERIVVKPDMSVIGPLYKGKAGKVLAALKGLGEEDLTGDEIKIEIDGEIVLIPRDLVEYETVIEEVRGERVIPHVIEPSFGIDRIIYAALEHSFEEEPARCLFCWDHVLENSGRLRKSLMDVYTGIDWVENAEIHKSDDCKTIRIFKDENSAEIIIDEDGEKATLKISDGRFGSLSVKKGVRDGLLYIYRVPVSEKTGAVAHTPIGEIPLPRITISVDAGRFVLHLPAEVAPVQVAVLPLLTREELITSALAIVKTLRKNGVFVSYDDSGTIGRRYRRNDEIGTPFSVTIDYETLDDDTVTIRDRDSMLQIRVQIGELAETIRAMIRYGFSATATQSPQ